MQAHSRDWLAGLASFVAECRRRRPVVGPAGPEAVAERTVLAAHFVSWFDELPAVLEARRRHAAATGADPEAALVLTTAGAGIEAATALLAGGHPLATAEAWRIVSVTELEYRLWSIRHPDQGHARHFSHWNWLKTRVPPQRDREFARHRRAAGESWWLQRTGTAGAGTADRRDCHLWKWNGVHAALVEPFVREERVSHFAADRPTDGDD